MIINLISKQPKLNFRLWLYLQPLLQILFNVPLFSAEVRANQGNLFATCKERLGVVLLLDLCHRLFGCAVVFELKNIDVIRCFDGHVHATVGGVKLSFCVESTEVAKDEKHVLIVVFCVFDEVVGNICKERFQTGHETANVAGLHFFYKTALSIILCKC